MNRSTIQTKNAPAAIGPYSQAVRHGSWIFCSGQVPIDPDTGALVPGDIRQQTKQVMKNLDAVLKEGGAGFEHVVKTTIYLANLADFAAVNEIYAEAFPQNPPARATVQVAALPLRARVEIDAIAVID